MAAIIAACVALAALAPALALAGANRSSPLDCVCSRIYNDTDGDIWAGAVTAGERSTWFDYCAFASSYYMVERCETLEQPSTALAAVAQVVPWHWTYGPPPSAVGISCEPPPPAREWGAALAADPGLTGEEDWKLDCDMADAVIDYYSARGLNDTKWTVETLAADDLRHPKLSQLLDAAQSFMSATVGKKSCARRSIRPSGSSPSGLASDLKRYANYWQGALRLFTHLVKLLSQLFIPLAFEHMGNYTNGQQLGGWINNMERVRDMLDMRFRGLLQHAQSLSDQTANYKVEENKKKPGRYIIRRPLLSERLLDYQDHLLSFRGDFGALCKQQLPQAAQVFGLADALYFIYREYFTPGWPAVTAAHIIVDEEWQLEDQSQTEVWVDTGCLQLLADAVNRPRCPLEELPLEARQCRQRLWRDLVERPPRPPVTSYLAYSERTSVSLCLLAWMAANSRGLCQDVPFSITQSVHDAQCYFESPHNETCLLSETTDAICSVSRATLLLKCRDFLSVNFPKLCKVLFYRTGHYSNTDTWEDNDEYELHGKATERTLSYKESLNSGTLKYRNFKVDLLKPLEYSFIAVSVLFRLSTASVYMWLPHLHNLPGKILLSFQLTGLAQVLCSEVLYRAAGFPDVSTAALVDSSLTLLGCLWLNLFCYQLYVCANDLRLPDHLTPVEASIVFRRQLRWALIPWAMVSTACAATEKSSKHYLLYSRITLTVSISSSIALNLVLLGLVAFKFLRSKKSMRRLNIIGGDKGFSKKQITFMSINTIILSGICVIIRIGFHQSEGLAQYVYYVHIATMLQGPVLFVSLACNEKTLPALRSRVLALWKPDVYRPAQELGSAARKNLARRRAEAAQTAL